MTMQAPRPENSSRSTRADPMRFDRAAAGVAREIERFQPVENTVYEAFVHAAKGVDRTVAASSKQLSAASASVKQLQQRVDHMVTRARGARQRAYLRLVRRTIRAGINVYGQYILLFLCTVLALVLVVQFDDAILRFFDSLRLPTLWPSPPEQVPADTGNVEVP